MHHEFTMHHPGLGGCGEAAEAETRVLGTNSGPIGSVCLVSALLFHAGAMFEPCCCTACAKPRGQCTSGKLCAGSRGS